MWNKYNGHSSNLKFSSLFLELFYLSCLYTFGFYIVPQLRWSLQCALISLCQTLLQIRNTPTLVLKKSPSSFVKLLEPCFSVQCSRKSMWNSTYYILYWIKEYWFSNFLLMLFFLTFFTHMGYDWLFYYFPYLFKFFLKHKFPLCSWPCKSSIL